MQAEYYNKILYPLQDKAIMAFINSPFYLNGGTALSRGYYNHRYSDAESKAAGIAPFLIAKIFSELDYTLIDTEIKWITSISSEIIRGYMTEVSYAILRGSL